MSANNTPLTKIWNQFCPFIITTRPCSDLCRECQENMVSIFKSNNATVPDKTAQLRRQDEHLHVVKLERDLYRTIVDDSKLAIDGEILGANLPCSRNITMHYLIDFTQQVHYPSNPEQPCPIYILCPHTCGLFALLAWKSGGSVGWLIDWFFFLNLDTEEMQYHSK